MALAIRDEVIEELLQGYRSPEDLLGEEGLFKELKKRLLERALGAELTEHLGYERAARSDEKKAPPRPGTLGCVAGCCNWPGAGLCSRREARCRNGKGSGARVPRPSAWELHSDYRSRCNARHWRVDWERRRVKARAYARPLRGCGLDPSALPVRVARRSVGALRRHLVKNKKGFPQDRST